MCPRTVLLNVLRVCHWWNVPCTGTHAYRWRFRSVVMSLVTRVMSPEHLEFLLVC